LSWPFFLLHLLPHSLSTLDWTNHKNFVTGVTHLLRDMCGFIRERQKMTRGCKPPKGCRKVWKVKERVTTISEVFVGGKEWTLMSKTRKSSGKKWFH
jgi:hypothetical protein